MTNGERPNVPKETNIRSKSKKTRPIGGTVKATIRKRWWSGVCQRTWGRRTYNGDQNGSYTKTEKEFTRGQKQGKMRAIDGGEHVARRIIINPGGSQF